MLELDKLTDAEHRKLITVLKGILLLLQIASIVLLSYERIKWAHLIPADERLRVLMDVLCMMIASFFSLSIIRAKRQSPEAAVFLVIVFFDVMHLFSDGIFRVVNGRPDYIIWNNASNIVFLVCPLMMTAAYWIMLDNWMNKSGSRYRRADITITVITVVGIILAIGNTLFGYYSKTGADGYYYRGELYVMTIIIPLIPIILCVGRILKSTLSVQEKLVLLSFPVIPVVAAIGQYRLNQSAFVTVATFFSIVLVYTNFLTTKEGELALMENQMTMSKLYSLQMQINPHMLFNTMSSIAGMCDIDPEKAQDMIFKLSDYLRDNFTDIDKPTMVILREELEHLDHYMAIEMMRFPNISIVKDIKRDDFLIPRMTLQPLVENAIKHGICKRRRAEGTLWIRAYETSDAWVVSVEDNGVGFDHEKPMDNMGEHHGIYNVRTRLTILCDGILEIEGKPGEGTISTIKIPK